MQIGVYVHTEIPVLALLSRVFVPILPFVLIQSLPLTLSLLPQFQKGIITAERSNHKASHFFSLLSEQN